MLSPSLAFLSKSPSRCHQASAECRFTLTHLQIPLPIHSSHKPNSLEKLNGISKEYFGFMGIGVEILFVGIGGEIGFVGFGLPLL